MNFKKNTLVYQLLINYAPACVCLLAPLTLMGMQKVAEHPLALPQDQFPEIILLAQKNDAPRLLELLESNSEAISVRCGRGYTALHWASFFGHQRTVAHLLVFKANLYALTLEGKTALQLAEEKGHEQVVKMLRSAIPEHEAARVSKDSSRRSLNVTSSSDTLAQNLVKPLSSSHEGDLMLDDLEAMEAKRSGARISSPLHKAVSQGKRLEVLLVFDLGGGAYLTEKDNSGDMPLHVAVNKGYNDIAALLLHYGAPVNELNRSGQTPLFVAVINRNEELAKTLLAHDAAVDIPDNSGETPLSYVQAKDDAQMSFILENKHLYGELKQTNKPPVRRERTLPAVLVKQVVGETSDEPQVDKAPTRNGRKGFRLSLNLFRKKK